MTTGIEKQFYGTEPEWNRVFLDEQDKEIAIVRALNWYNTMASDAEFRKWLLEYLKSSDLGKYNSLKDISEKEVTIKYGEIDGCYGFKTGAVARLLSLKAPVDDRTVLMFNKCVDYLIEKQTKTTQPKKEPRATSIKDAMDNNISDIIANIEKELDLIKHDDDVTFGEKSVTVLTKNNPLWLSLKQSYYKPVLDHFSGVIKEYTENDYFVFGKNTKTKKLEYLRLLTDYCNKKLAEKPIVIRKKTRKSPIDQVKKVQYLKEDSTLKISSIAPSKIIGASKVLLYNTKYRVVSIIEAETSQGFEVKGTTILYFSEKSSKSKKLRKPEDFFKEIKDKGIRAVKSAFESLKTTEYAATGRINKDTIIYGVY